MVSIPTIRSRARFGRGYGYDDYGPTCYTDIDPYGLNERERVALISAPPTVTRHPADGLLKQGKTRIAECTDGLSKDLRGW